jgi:predicted DNA-binding transcriptional regulator AlpA
MASVSLDLRRDLRPTEEVSSNSADAEDKEGEEAHASEIHLVVEPLLMSAPVAARVCGVSERTWWKLLAKGMVPAPVRLGRRRLWQLSAVRDWVQGGCRSPASQTGSPSRKTL